jgi:hypothetical protein
VPWPRSRSDAAAAANSVRTPRDTDLQAYRVWRKVSDSIDAIWQDGRIELLMGVFVGSEATAKWVNDRGDAWIEERQPFLPLVAHF